MTFETTDKIATRGLTFLAWVGVIILIALMWAHVLEMLWGWFVVPLGERPIGISEAFGLLLVAAVFLNGIARWRPRPDTVTREIVTAVLLHSLSAMLTLALGAIAHLFV